MRLLSRAGTSVAAVGLCLTPVFAEDLTIVSTVTTGRGAPTTSTQYFSTDKLRTSEATRDHIVDLGAGRLITVDHKQREYVEVSTADAAQALRDMEAQLQKNPTMDRMFGELGEVRVEKGTGTRRIAGYDTQQYVLSIGESLRVEVWAAPALPVPPQYFEARRMVLATLGPVARRLERIYAEMRKIDGFPLAVSISAKSMAFRQERLTEATEVRKGPLAPSVFEVPAGYTRKDSPFARKRQAP